jgi:HEAT repeat protein
VILARYGHNNTTMMRKIRPLLTTCLLFVVSAFSGTIDLPPIDKPLPFGIDVIPLPPPPSSNDTNPRTVQLLAEELQLPGTMPDRKAELIGDLGHTQLAVALAPLCKAASDSDPTIRAAIARAIGMIHDPNSGNTEAREEIARLAVDVDAQVRAEAIRSAAAFGMQNTVTAGIQDGDPDVVAAALSVAGIEQSQALMPRVADPDERLRILAIDAVARARIATEADAVAAQLDADVPTRIEAIGALSAVNSTRHAQDILKMLSDVHPTVRREATTALPNILSASDAQSHAIAMLSDGDESVRTAAALVLVEVPGPAAVAPLSEQLSDPYLPLHDAARTALLATGNATVQVAANLLGDRNPRRREDGSYLLGMLASGAAFEQHVKLLDDTNWLVVAQAAKSLGQISNPAAAPDLVRALDRAISAIAKAGPGNSEAASMVATNAVVSAAQLGYAPIGAKVKAYIFQKSIYPSNLRSAAIWAIGVVGTTDEASVFGQLPSLVEDPLEALDVKIEAIKAVGNRKSAVGHAVFSGGNDPNAAGEKLAIIHWCKDRINGTVTPFSLPARKFVADSSVTAMRAP